MIFRDKEYDWRYSNYNFCHPKTLHCAEKKSFAYREVLDVFQQIDNHIKQFVLSCI